MSGLARWTAVFSQLCHLIGGEFLVGEEMNQITLNFSSHTVSLKGYRLESLFFELMDHLPKIVIVQELGYFIREDSKHFVIETIVAQLER